MSSPLLSLSKHQDAMPGTKLTTDSDQGSGGHQRQGAGVRRNLLARAFSVFNLWP
ncbi:MAG TPA: hypothetical protein VGB17_06185 [Pyrinomonadaceae bacterium]